MCCLSLGPTVAPGKLYLMQVLWLYLHFPHLQLDSLSYSKLAMGGEPVSYPQVVLHPADNQVLQLNQQARQAGISMHMSLGSAAALSRDLQVIPFNPQVEQDQLKKIAESLYLVTSDICFFSPQGLLLRVHNMLTLYGDLPTYWRVVKHQLATMDITYHFGTGVSPFAAKLLGVAGLDKISDNRLKMSQQVARVAIKYSELPPKVVAKLAGCGVHRIGELLDIPASELAQRFDSQLVTYLNKLTAETQHPVNFYHPADKFSRYLELLYDIDSVARLLRPIEHLLAGLEHFLLMRDTLTQQLKITLYHRDQPNAVLEVGAQQGEYLSKRWLTLLNLKLESLSLNAPVYALQLTTGTTYVRTPDKGDLFSTKQGMVSRLQLVSLLQAKLGDHGVLSPRLIEDFRPEVACHFGPPLCKQPALGKYNTLRPSFLLPSPQRLHEKVTIVLGPERIDTGWWDSRPVVRDYFIARNSRGQWYWIFRTPKAQWYLHGVFS